MPLIIIIAISLSMDAFSLSLAYGTLSLSKKEIYLLSAIVGVYHFVMPVLGNYFGLLILKIIPFKLEVLVFIIFLVIGIQMIIESFKNKQDVHPLKVIEMIAFGLAVSLDSFTVGIGIKTLANSVFIPPIIFTLSSFTFTILGLALGNKANKLFGKLSTILGGLTLIIIGIIYLIP